MFHLRLLGTLQIDQDGTPVRGFDSRKALALLGYLVERGQPVARSHLADLFWPDRPEAQGRANLSRALYPLSTLLPGCLQADRYTVQFQPDTTFWIDTLAFTAFVAQGQTAALAAAVALYHDDFMTDVALDDCPEFELWLVREREHWHQRVAMTLGTLVTQHSEHHEYATALQFATRLTTLEPWREEAHRQVMQLLALTGQRSAALAHYETCRRLLAEELSVEPAVETVALVEQIRAGNLDKKTRRQEDREQTTRSPFLSPLLPVSLSPRSAELTSKPLPVSLSDPHTGAALHNLPAPLTSFLGREEEIAQLTQYLSAPLTRLVTIVGEGGMGKTRLALTLGQRIAEFGVRNAEYRVTTQSTPHSPFPTPHSPLPTPHSPFPTPHSPLPIPHSPLPTPYFPDGLWFVPLVGVEGGAVEGTANQLATAIAKSIAFSFGSAAVAPAEQLIGHLRLKALLLILDNFEHLTDGAPFVVELLQQAPQVRVLVTSRRPLNCQAEQLLRLTGLPVILAERPDAPVAPSIALFTERARRQRADFVLTQETLPAVINLCRLVNGNPLALELAAHWVQHVSVAEIIDTLQQQDLALLTTDQQDVPDRHRTIAAVFETSWQLLSPSQQRALAQLSVFRGAFTREAALAVTDATLVDLVALGNCSLLGQEHAQPDRVYYTIHELLRQFAARKLSALEATLSGTSLGAQLATQPAVHQRHSEYYLRLVATHGPLLYSRDTKSALAELHPAIDNIRAAWRWAVTQGNAATLGEAWFGLRSFYHVRSLFQEGEELFRLSAAQLRTRAAPPTDLLAELQITQAFFLNLMHQYEGAIIVAQAVLATGPQKAQNAPIPQPASAQAQLEWGIALSLQCKHDEAVTKLTVAVELAQRLALPVVTARALYAMQRSLMAKGEFSQVSTLLEDALRAYQQVGYRLAEGFVLRSLAIHAYHRGYNTRALAALEEALRIYQEAEDQPRIISLWKMLGDVHSACGDWGHARSYYLAAYAQCSEVHDPIYTADSLEGCARLMGRLGDYAAAQQYGQQALALQRQVNHPHGIIESLCTLGWLQNQVGNAAAALAHYREAAALIQHSSAQLFEGMALLGMGQALVGLGQREEAAAIYHQALAVQQALGQPQWVLQTTGELAALALAQARLVGALTLVDEILVNFPMSTLPGANEPMRLYLICYQVLQANQDQRAQELLHQAYQWLQTQVATIDEAGLRQSFLEQVVVNRALVAAYEQHSNPRSA